MKKSKRKHSAESSQSYLIKGNIDITRSGIGYVIATDGKGDVLVRPGDFNTALHGDTVRVKVTKDNVHSGRREGKIMEVVSRKQKEFVGTLQLSTNYAFFVPDTDKPMPDIFIPLENVNGAKHKEKVIVRLLQWDNGDRKPTGEVIETMTNEGINRIAMKEIITENGFSLAFSDEVIEESERLPDTIAAKEIKRRKDCRDILTFTIDPVDAKDFDDAISLQKISNGLYEIGVHIADVSHYVQEGTALDKEAYQRATSVYLPDRVNPMLPERISNKLCSLRPNEDKLTFSVIFKINTKGEVKEHSIGRTVIHSDHRFSYEDVQQIIESGKGIHLQEIKLLNGIAQKLRKQRFTKGAINFSSQEVRFKLDETGKPIGIVIKESKEAHQLIEEFMLLANKTIAENVSRVVVNKKHVPFPYRIHNTPDEQKLLPFIEFAKRYGHRFDISTPEKIAHSFNTLLNDAKGKPEQHVLEQLGIRTMAKAVYAVENIGHYGLGFENYCHFTSPIRRYPDVLVHRILQSCLDKNPVIDKKMEEKCAHCSERERAAMDAERAANKYKQVEFMIDFIGDEFDAIISGVASFGFWAETVDHKCEGLISVNDLSDYDDFRLIETDYALVGKRSGRRFGMGDKIKIKVVSGNLSKRQLDYEWVMSGEIIKNKKQETNNREQKNSKNNPDMPGLNAKQKRKKF